MVGSHGIIDFDQDLENTDLPMWYDIIKNAKMVAP
jgi:hypothetical protein